MSGIFHNYSQNDLRRDLAAGLTVACVALPQSMAYAMVAGVPPVYGLYGVIVAATVGALLTSSSHLTIGPTNTCALVTASAFAAFGREPNALRLMFLLTFMVGALQFTAGVLKLGFLTDYISEAVMVGFTSAAGVLIAGNQIANFLGYAHPNTRHFLVRVGHALAEIADFNPYALLLGILAILITVGVRAIHRYAPGALLAVFLTGLIAYLGNFEAHGVKLVGAIPRTIPPPRPFLLSLERAADLAPGALAIAVMGLFEAIAIGRAIAMKSGQQIEANREFVAIGTANMVGSFFQCIPSSGSFGRSALNFQAGAKTRAAVFISAGTVALSMLIFAPFAYYIPIPTLAGILMVVAAGLIDWKRIHSLAQVSRDDRITMGATFLAALLIRLEFALFLGVGLSVLLFLQNARHVHVDELGFDAEGRVYESSGPAERFHPAIAVVNLEGDLFFGAARELSEHLERFRNDKLRVIILRLKRARGLDATILRVLSEFIEEQQHQGRHVLLTGIWGEVARKIWESPIYSIVGARNVFIAQKDIFSSTRQALQRAYELLDQEDS